MIAAILKEQRKSPRRAISRLAKIEVGSLIRNCLVTDISDGGARLYVEAADVPETFVLLLGDEKGVIRPRDCQMIWRLGFELGAKFTDALGRGRRAKRAKAVKQPAMA